MKILYGIQGTGNGHISRARDIIPALQKHGEVHVLVSGTQSDVHLGFEITYRFKGLSFIFGTSGGVDVLKTLMKSNMKRLYKEIGTIDLTQYDIIISDFEPITAWGCQLNKIDCIGLSHQLGVLHPNAPTPNKLDIIGEFIMRNYAPVSISYGFHFEKYGSNVFLPIIRDQVRSLEISNEGHITVYLPAFEDEYLVKKLSIFKTVNWEVFSKHAKKVYKINNITFKPIENSSFLESMASSDGVLCGAGFETPAEALYLKKKLLVVPMKYQYEQHCNAASLHKMGVPVIKNLKKKHLHVIGDWLQSDLIVNVDYPNDTQEIIDTVLSKNMKS